MAPVRSATGMNRLGGTDGAVQHSQAHQRLDGLNPARVDVLDWLIDE